MQITSIVELLVQQEVKLFLACCELAPGPILRNLLQAVRRCPELLCVPEAGSIHYYSEYLAVGLLLEHIVVAGADWIAGLQLGESDTALGVWT